MEGIKRKLDFYFSGIEPSQWIFAAVFLTLGALLWFFVYLAFYQVYSGLQIWALAAFSLTALAICAGLSFFIFTRRALAISVYIILGLISFVFWGWRGYEFLGILVFIATAVFAYSRVKREESLLIKLFYLRLIRKGLPMFLTGLAFALAVFYNASPMGNLLEDPQIPKGFFDLTLIPVEYSLKQTFPDFERSMKMGELENLTSRELPTLFDMPPLLISGFVRGLFEDMDESVKKKTLTQFLSENVNMQLAAILAPYKRFLPVVFVFGLFLVFKAIGIPLMWISAAVSWFLVRLLLRFNILRVVKVDSQKEKLIS